MDNSHHLTRNLLIFTLLLLGLVWSLALAQVEQSTSRYPADNLLVSPDWLARQSDDQHLVIVDVRNDGVFDGRMIPGAIRLPWSKMRYNNTGINEGSLFVGAAQAQKILGEHGIGRTDTVVLYDSVQEDGGATASYLFLVLDYLGHERKMILEGGIDAWIQADHQLASRPRDLSPILYQAPMAEIKRRIMISGRDIYERLDDPHYQIVDVRSSDEYLGNKGTRDLQGNGLKLGHIPTAVNIPYSDVWKSKEEKLFKSYNELQELYRGLDPEKTIIVYCNSGRRSSFVFFTLQLMGFDKISSYEASWKQWGKPANFYPVTTRASDFIGNEKPDSHASAPDTKPHQPQSKDATSTKSGTTQDDQPTGGYVSCGG
nr:rhodanese-like domain-containing protein [uncultured Desulfobulbus sp.]